MLAPVALLWLVAILLSDRGRPGGVTTEDAIRAQLYGAEAQMTRAFVDARRQMARVR